MCTSPNEIEANPVARCFQHTSCIPVALARAGETSPTEPDPRMFSSAAVGSQSHSPEQYYCYKFRGFWIPVALPPSVSQLRTSNPGQFLLPVRSGQHGHSG